MARGDDEITIEDVFGDAAELQKRKDADYGSAWTETGFIGLYVYIHRKFKAIQNAVWFEKPRMSGEDLEEQFMDLMNYAAFGVMMCRNCRKYEIDVEDYDKLLRSREDE